MSNSIQKDSINLQQEWEMGQ